MMLKKILKIGFRYRDKFNCSLNINMMISRYILVSMIENIKWITCNTEQYIYIVLIYTNTVYALVLLTKCDLILKFFGGHVTSDS